MVLSAGRKARLPASAGRLCRDRQGCRERVEARRPHAVAAGDCRGQYQRRCEIRPPGLRHRGVRLTGIDGWSWDAPFVYTAKKYAETRDASLIWEGHKAGRHIGYCHIEKLHNLEQLPSTGFMVSCFPVKIERASAGWTRAVAIIDG